MKSIIAFLKDESGQTSIEYVLLIVVGAMLVFKFSKTAETEMNTLTEGVFGKARGFLDGIK